MTLAGSIDKTQVPVYSVTAPGRATLKYRLQLLNASRWLFPYMLYRHIEEFTLMAGPGVPAIYRVNNGVVEYKSKYAYYQLDPKYMLQWLKEGK